VSWSATPSTWAGGYEILRSLVSGGPYTSVGTVNGATTTTYNDNTALFSTLYRYVVRATKASWRSPNSNEAAITTMSVLCV
jgi:triphosphoribosyl-dephospho-CoA synthetase